MPRKGVSNEALAAVLVVVAVVIVAGFFLYGGAPKEQAPEGGEGGGGGGGGGVQVPEVNCDKAAYTVRTDTVSFTQKTPTTKEASLEVQIHGDSPLNNLHLSLYDSGGNSTTSTHYSELAYPGDTVSLSVEGPVNATSFRKVIVSTPTCPKLVKVIKNESGNLNWAVSS